MFEFRVGIYNDDFDKEHDIKDGLDKPAIKQMITAATPSKARWQFYQYFREFYVMDFRDFLDYVWVEKVGLADIHYLFGDTEMFESMKEQRQIPNVWQGMKIEVDGKPGRIVGGNYSANIDVVFEGEWTKNNCHPHYKTVYYDNYGKVVYDFRNNVKGE